MRRKKSESQLQWLKHWDYIPDSQTVIKALRSPVIWLSDGLGMHKQESWMTSEGGTKSPSGVSLYGIEEKWKRNSLQLLGLNLSMAWKHIPYGENQKVGTRSENIEFLERNERMMQAEHLL